MSTGREPQQEREPEPGRSQDRRLTPEGPVAADRPELDSWIRVWAALGSADPVATPPRRPSIKDAVMARLRADAAPPSLAELWGRSGSAGLRWVAAGALALGIGMGWGVGAGSPPWDQADPFDSTDPLAEADVEFVVGPGWGEGYFVSLETDLEVNEEQLQALGGDVL